MTTARPEVRPVGREQVMSAIVGAAADLFASKGPAATSIREVAARSGVNHGLVYRHFGTKDSLVAAVLDALSYEHAATGGDEVANDRHLRVLARTILDGYPVGQLQGAFPTVQGLVATARRYQPNEIPARLAAAQAVALALGWQLFEPFIRSAAGLETLPSETLNAAARDTAGQLLRGSARPIDPL